ncbi:MAG: PAS domain S-box protein [Desulfobacula sp.]|nr:PAS domain S-box protein [Desulfobacula sp.]
MTKIQMIKDWVFILILALIIFFFLQREIRKYLTTGKVLQKSEEKYRRIFDNLQDGYLWADSDGNILLANQFAANILGYDLKELMQKNMAQDIYFVPEDRETVKEIMIRNGEIDNYELAFKRKDGQKIIVEANSHLLYDEKQQRSMEGTFRDITFRKQAETAQANLEKQLRQAQNMEAIGTLAGGIAHDFNNILSSVMGYTELVLYEMEEDTLQYGNLSQVMKAANRAKNLVQQILTFSRQTDQEQKPFQVKLIVKEALKLLRATIPSTIEIRHNIQSDAMIMGDSTQIHQVLMNLCTNATHSMEDSGGLLTVDLISVGLDYEMFLNYPGLKRKPYILLTVTDVGPGMTPSVLEKIFDPFFTTKEKGKGTGMGLSVVHGIVHSHGGKIYASSDPGKGSVFKVFLPTIKKNFKPENRNEKPIPTGTENLLLIDDEPAIVDMGRQILDSLGYQVTIKTNPIEALELFGAEHKKFDLVITDMTMPKMTGASLAKELMRIKPDVKVILCTGFSSMIDEKKAIALGFKAFVSKPILKREIGKVIREVLDG